MSESERRSGAKLHKQLEVEDDDVDDGHQQQHKVTPAAGAPKAPSADPHSDVGSNHGTASGRDTAQQSSSTSSTKSEDTTAQSSVNISGVRTPTIQSASSSSETSPDEGQPQAPITPAFTRKQTLTRTQALEGTSPPPESLSSQQPHQGSSLDVSGHSLTNGGGGGGGGSAETVSGQVPGSSSSLSIGQVQKKGSQSSSQEAKEFLRASHKISNDSGHGTLDTTDACSDTSVLSRDSSLESSAANLYKDSSGVDIPRFIRETMLKSPKDKKTVLTYERQLLDFCRSETLNVLKMAEATSYDRMIAHRLSAFMGLDHNVDPTGKSVIINKTENMRVVKITDFIKLDDAEQETKKKILLKKPASLDEKNSRGASKGQFGSHRAKSLEERQQIYSEVRERIFNDGENQGDTLTAPSLLNAHCMPQLHHQRSLDSARPIASSAQFMSQFPSVSTPAAAPSSLPGHQQLQHHSQLHHQPHHHLQQQQTPHHQQAHQQHHHPHHLHPARWASTDSAPGRSSQGATDLRATTMIKSNSYGGVGSNPNPVHGLPGNEPTSSMLMSVVDPQKDSSTVLYGGHLAQPGQGGSVVPSPLCPANPAVVAAAATTHQQLTEQGPPEEGGSSPLAGSAGGQHQTQSQQMGQQQQQQPQAVPSTSVAYLISSDYTSIPLGSLIIDPNTMQPHVNADGSLYRFDPNCPPPFMTQALIQPSSPSAQQLSYQMENLSMSEMGGKFPTPGIDPASGVTGQLVMSHPQATYPSSHPIQFSQGQYYPSLSPGPAAVPGQPPFHVLTYAPAPTPLAPHGQGHQVHPQPQILQASPLEAQGQTTVPMPAVGVPPSFSGTTAYVLGPAPYDISGVGTGAGVTMFAPSPYPPTMETLSSGIAAPLPHQQHPQLVQYNIAAAPYSQHEPHLHQLQQQQQQQPQLVVPHSGAGHTAYLTAVQAPSSSSTPTPPPHPTGMVLSHIPPPQQQASSSLKALSQPHLHHTQLQQQGQHLAQQQQQQQHLQQQQQQPAVFFPNLGNLTMSQMTPVFPGTVSSNPQPSSIVVSQPPSTSSAPTAAPKPGPSPYIQYHSSPPPPPPQPQPLHHQQGLNQQVVASPSNGHHHAHPATHLQQLTLNCTGQPLSLGPTNSSNPNPAQRGGGAAVPQQLVAYHPMRPMGTIIHVGGGPSVQTSVQPLVQPTPVGPAQLQILRPTGPEMRMVNPGSIRPRVASLQFSNSFGPHSHSKPSNRQQKKGKRAMSETKDLEDASLIGGGGGGGDSLRGRPPQTVLGSTSVQGMPQPHHHHPQQQQQQPLIVTPLLPGMVGHPQIAPSSAHTRQDPSARL
ncbi:R3h domain-containing protein 1 [Plakobranchus ocellatus]|uniref:R3h domain-containing protein 1 n=1 Tax=Plakobranchus ocellatus TaxID=259542 RepID=A0AAV4BMA4_9GAST|nr:R3h domain-containing protein 1 [Plakobranchus ocellatus]